MSTGLIIAIVVVAVLCLGVLAFVLPRTRARGRERELARERRQVAGAHRDAAAERTARAEQAERIARSERAEAELHESRAELHDQGLADDDLGADRARFERDQDAGVRTDEESVEGDEVRRAPR